MSPLRAVSVSLGSSERDRRVETELAGEEIILERIGTDGSLDRAAEKIAELDGEVDAFGLGGIDLYLWVGETRYEVRDARKLADAAQKTPVVDGSGVKHTMERAAVEFLSEHAEYMPVPLSTASVLMVSGVDRWGMAAALSDHANRVIYGDLMFALGLPVPLTSLAALERVARVAVPVAVRLPFKMLYPTGDEQKETSPRFAGLYQDADLVAGDFHLIKKHLPEELPDTSILTNTTTGEDRERLDRAGVKALITTTPVFDGRSFGTNLLEAAFVAIGGAERAGDREYYRGLLNELDYEPGVQVLNDERREARAG